MLTLPEALRVLLTVPGKRATAPSLVRTAHGIYPNPRSDRDANG